MMYTVALPTWDNKNILWLPMEGLCRQRTTRDWELIVMECRSPNEAGKEFFEGYWERLQLAGCKRLLYIYTAKRVPLGQKWKEMAKRAEGKYFLLQASDDYPHPGRIQAVTMDGDWYDTRYFHTWSLISKRMVLFDRLSLKGWKTGNDMATLTEKVRNLPDNNMNKGVDFYLFGKCCTKRTMDEEIYRGINTNGANVISLTRERHYKKPMPPFRRPYRDLDEIGLPDEIYKRLVTFEQNGSTKVRAILVKDFMQYKPGDTRDFNPITFGTLQKEGVVKLEDRKEYEHENRNNN